jgi:hypothetical protein
MNRTDADVSLTAMFLNLVVSASPIHDSLFSSHQRFERPDTHYFIGETETYWAPDNVAGVVGCTEQVCNPCSSTSCF